MSLFAALAKMAQGAESLRQLLTMALEVPDLAPLAQEWLEKLEQGVAIEGLADLVADLPKEAKDIVMLKLDPRDSPSSAI